MATSATINWTGDKTFEVTILHDGSAGEGFLIATPLTEEYNSPALLLAIDNRGGQLAQMSSVVFYVCGITNDGTIDCTCSCTGGVSTASFIDVVFLKFGYARDLRDITYAIAQKWRAIGADAANDTIKSQTWDYTFTRSAAQPLATPTGLNASNITSTGSRIGWNAVANATGYKVEYKPHNSSTWIEG